MGAAGNESAKEDAFKTTAPRTPPQSSRGTACRPHSSADGLIFLGRRSHSRRRRSRQETSIRNRLSGESASDIIARPVGIQVSMISAGLQAQAQLSTTLTAKMAGGLAKLCHSESSGASIQRDPRAAVNFTLSPVMLCVEVAPAGVGLSIWPRGARMQTDRFNPSVRRTCAADFAGQYLPGAPNSSASDQDDLGSSRHDPSFGDHHFTGVAIALVGIVVSILPGPKAGVAGALR